ncbi:MAG: glycosyltransferase family 4 protein [Gammaproteobacteria bacterium]|nr:glycosyltransferase family 4 protein [Gammaproteobacteria bacterium]
MEKPRILVLTSTYPSTITGNEPRFVADLSERLGKSFDVTVLTQHRPGTPLREDRNGITIVRYRYAPERFELLSENGGMANAIKASPLLIFLVPLLFLAQVLAIRKAVSAYRPQLIHAHWLIPQTLCAVIARYFCKDKPAIISTAHGGDVYGLKGPMMTAVKRWSLRRIEKLCVVSTAMRTYLSHQMGIDEAHIGLMPMGADLENTFVPNPEVERIPAQLIFVGRLVEKKGLRFLLDCIPELASQYTDMKLLIIGEGPEEALLRQRVQTMAIGDRVQFLGSLPHQEIAKLLQTSQCAVFPFVQAESGDMEGLGLVVIEAMGCGCLVVTGDVPAIHDMIQTKKTGLICNPGNPDSISKAISFAIGDRQSAAKIAQNGHKYAVATYGWDMCSNRYAALFSGMIEGND